MRIDTQKNILILPQIILIVILSCTFLASQGPFIEIYKQNVGNSS